MGDPGPLIGSGRAADVYDIGGGRVLRRYRVTRRAGDVEREALAMGHLAAAGYPVPAVFDAAGDDLVMERLDGHTLLTELERRPWRLRRHAELWAELVGRLGTVPVGDLVAQGVPTRFGEPEAILHLDFHPDNVMLGPNGPVVFDWSKVALGPAAAEVAQSWIIAATSSIDGNPVIGTLVRLVRGRLVDRFVDAAGRARAIEVLPVVAEYRLADRNLRPEEAERIHALVASMRPAG